jgi:ArsR family transcriptional regulator, arsenate/arsenite/antimonite-responsive transcriptional repressor
LSKYKIRNFIVVLDVNSVFRALKDQTRREILQLLQKKDLTAGEIAHHFNITKPSISHHLDLLKQANLVTAEKQGQFIYYSLNTTVVDELITWIIQLKKKR